MRENEIWVYCICHPAIDCYEYGNGEESASLPPITVPLLSLDSQKSKAKGKISSHLLVASVCAIMNFPYPFFPGACQCPYQKKKKTYH